MYRGSVNVIAIVAIGCLYTATANAQFAPLPRLASRYRGMEPTPSPYQPAATDSPVTPDFSPAGPALSPTGPAYGPALSPTGPVDQAPPALGPGPGPQLQNQNQTPSPSDLQIPPEQIPPGPNQPLKTPYADLNQPWNPNDPNAVKLTNGHADVVNDRMFFQADLLLWSVSRPDITTIGDQGSEGPVTVGGNTYVRNNSLDTGFISSDWTRGGRFDFGRISGEHGWMASVLYFKHQDSLDSNGAWFVPSDPDGLLLGYQDANNDNIDDDINNNQVHGRNGQDLGTPDILNPGTFVAPFDGTPDQGAPIDTGDLLNWLVTFDTVQASSNLHLTGIELMDLRRPGAGTVDWFYGIRYLEVRDQFGVFASGGILGTSFWSVNSDNDIIGPQIGLRWTKRRPWFRFTAEGRLLLGINFQKDRLNGSIGTNADFGGFNQPVAMEPTSFNTLQTHTEFSPVGEWRVEGSYYMTSWMALRMGYTGMVIGGVSRAGPQISYTLPSFTLNAGSNTTILTNGLTLGIEFNR